MPTPFSGATAHKAAPPGANDVRPSRHGPVHVPHARASEGEGEGEVGVGEGEGEVSVGEGEGEVSVSVGEGEGEGIVSAGEGEGEGEGETVVVAGEGEGEGTANPPPPAPQTGSMPSGPDVIVDDEPMPFTARFDLPGDGAHCFRVTTGIAATMSFGASDGGSGCPGDTFASYYNAGGTLLATDDNGGLTPPCSRLDMTGDRGTYEACFTSKLGVEIANVTVSGAGPRPRIFISEVASPSEANASYVELYNTTLHPMTLVDMHVEIGNGIIAPIPDGMVIPAATPGSIGDCQFTIVGDVGAFQSTFPNATYDVEVPAVHLDGTESVALYYGGQLIDIYDASQAQYRGLSAERATLVTTPSTTMNLAEWNLSTNFTPDYHVHP
jgi:hypothetical protein